MLKPLGGSCAGPFYPTLYRRGVRPGRSHEPIVPSCGSRPQHLANPTLFPWKGSPGATTLTKYSLVKVPTVGHSTSSNFSQTRPHRSTRKGTHPPTQQEPLERNCIHSIPCRSMCRMCRHFVTCHLASIAAQSSCSWLQSPGSRLIPSKQGEERDRYRERERKRERGERERGKKKNCQRIKRSNLSVLTDHNCEISLRFQIAKRELSFAASSAEKWQETWEISQLVVGRGIKSLRFRVSESQNFRTFTLIFWNSLLFSFARNALFFGVFFPFFPGILGGSSGKEILVFSVVFPAFFQKRKERKIRARLNPTLQVTVIRGGGVVCTLRVPNGVFQTVFFRSLISACDRGKLPSERQSMPENTSV